MPPHTHPIPLISAHEALLSSEFESAINLSLNALNYPKLTKNEQFFLYLIIIESYTQLREFDLADANIQQVLKELPSNKALRAQFYIDATKVQIYLQNPLKAIQYLDDYEFENCELNSTFHSLKAAIYILQNHYPNAETELEKADTIYAKAQLFALQKDLKSLESTTEQILENTPNFPGITQICANLAILSGTSQNALIYAKKCAEFSQVFQNFDGVEFQNEIEFLVTGKCETVLQNDFLRVQQLISEKKFPDAIFSLKQFQPSPAVFALLATCYAQLGDVQNTSKFTEKLLKIDSHDSLNAAGTAFRFLGNFQKAQKCFESALKKHQTAEILTNLADVKFLLNDAIGALKDAIAAKSICLLRYGKGVFYCRICCFLGRIYDVLCVGNGGKMLRGEGILICEEGIQVCEGSGLGSGEVYEELKVVKGRLKGR